MSSSRPVIEAFLKGRFSLLLINMVGLFFLVPLIGTTQKAIDQIFGWFSIAVLISCLRAISRSRHFFIFMILMTVINVLLGGSELLLKDESTEFLMIVLGFRITYFVLIFMSIMHFVLNKDDVTGDKICGAISAYLLMGVIWSLVYTVFFHMDPDSFSVPHEWLSEATVNSYWSIYFSFTTLTTLGYGDITPTKPLTQSYAVMQAALGQVFLGVIVARLIALHISTRKSR
ncbi:potassium channel family protein [Pontiellaceae bacterium B12219]|nr:potassium channel family protein [Pontiellaceae bacterium B12219]